MADYGPEHRKLRRLLLAAYVPGVTCCWRCRKPITTVRTREIHLGHDDANPLIWRGLEHAHCNLEAGGIKSGWHPGKRVRKRTRKRRTTTPVRIIPSRDW